MPLFTKKRCLKVSLESTKGTEVDAATDVLAFNPEIAPASEHSQRNGPAGSLGNNFGGIVEGQDGIATFSAELRSNGSAGMDAGLAVLLQACGLAKTSEVYQVHSTYANQKTISIDLYEDGKLKTLYGAMGNFKIEPEGKRVMLNFEFKGIYKDEADAALPSFSPGTGIPAKFESGTFLFGGSNRKVSKFAFDMAAEVVPENDIEGPGGVSNYMISDYNNVISIDPEAVLVATNDYYGQYKAGTSIAVSLALASGGDTLTLTMPACEIIELSPGERNKSLIYEINAQCLHSAGNDSFKIAVT